jgi:hypothetical protein
VPFEASRIAAKSADLVASFSGQAGELDVSWPNMGNFPHLISWPFKKGRS